jgi:hypothetical protein
MIAGERKDPKAGPFVNLGETCWSGLDLVAKGYEPTLMGMGRWNLELLGIMTRRSRAWLEIPARASQCKTPQDLVREQLQFWQTAAHDYSDGARRLTMAFGALAAPGSIAAPKRDYIDVPDAKPVAAEAPRRERRAA